MKKNKLLLALIAPFLLIGSIGSNSISTSFAGASYQLTFKDLKGTTDNFLKGVWDDNKGDGSCTNAHYDLDASGSYCARFTRSGTSNAYIGYAWANNAMSAFTQEGTYAVYFKYKTDANDSVSSFKFQWQGDYQNKQIISTVPTSWTECYFTMDLTTSILGNGTCLFLLESVGNLYLDDLSVIPISRQVEEGKAIGELPEIPSKEGFNASWQIDGETITKDTIYNYGQNKTAIINYEKIPYKLVFGGTGKAVTTNMFAYTAGWWSASKGNDGHVSDGTFSNVDFSLAGGAIYFSADVYNYSKVVKNGNYCFTFDYYAESDVSFNVSHNDVTLATNLTATNKWQTYSIAYTCLKTLEILKFFNSAKSGIIKFTNLIISEIGVSVELKKGDKIGPLPTVPLKEGARGYWAIDGNKITEETIYNFDSNKTAIPTYEYGMKLSFIGNEDDYMKDLTSDVSKWLVVPSIPLEIKKDNDAITFKGVTRATSRFVDRENFHLVTGRTYNLKFMVKTGNAKIFFVANNWKQIILSNYSADDWTSIDVNFVAPEPYTDQGEERYAFDLQIINNSDTTAINEVSLKNMILTSITAEHSYFSGDKINNLPNVPKDSAWVVESTVLKEGVVYPFIKDKKAYMAPVIYRGETSSFDYHIDHKLELDISYKSFYYGDVSFECLWYKDGAGDPVSKPTEIGQYKLIVFAVDTNGTKSITSAEFDVNVLAKDVDAPEWVKGDEPYVYPTGLCITVKKGTYAQLNLEAYDELDGFIIVEYDFNSLVDALGRFVEGEGDIVCIAKDLTNNTVKLIIHIIVI